VRFLYCKKTLPLIKSAFPLSIITVFLSERAFILLKNRFSKHIGTFSLPQSEVFIGNKHRYWFQSINFMSQKVVFIGNKHRYLFQSTNYKSQKVVFIGNKHFTLSQSKVPLSLKKVFLCHINFSLRQKTFTFVQRIIQKTYKQCYLLYSNSNMTERNIYIRNITFNI
jgi:hypothetical protein